jgi:hypothetical protein
MTLVVRGRSASSVFGLLGSDENSATFALGWVLERSPALLARVVEDVVGKRVNVEHAVIHLQKHREQGGFTDVELVAAGRFHIILEAKRGWDLPSAEQLTRYAVRLDEAGADAERRLVSVSAADAGYASRHMLKTVGGIPALHCSWTDVRRMAEASRSAASSNEEKLWLRQLVEHLGEYIAVDQVSSNRVYVVSLGIDPMVDGGTHTWVDVVEKDGCYFHPISAGWPQQPPNYIAFRHHGRLQSVHHIDSYEVVSNLAERNPLWLETSEDHFVYRLGPAMRPVREMRTGNIFRNGRVWCAIDTLLSGAFQTISDARDETQRRVDGALGG